MEIDKKTSCLSYFTCFSKDSKDPKLPLLVLKYEPKKELINMISNENYLPVLTKTNAEAIAEYKKSTFAVVIAALGILPDFSDNYLPLIEEIRKQNKSTFIIISSDTASQNAKTRELCFDQGVNMVSICVNSIGSVLKQIYKQLTTPGNLTCPICSLSGLSEDSLWHHLPLYHICEKNIKPMCPYCKEKCKPNLQVHFHNAHGPCARKEHPLDKRDDIQLYAFALVVVHRKKDNKFLLVQEFADSGFWLPGGGVDLGESLLEAAERETLEEAGVEIKITGVLTVQYMCTSYARLRVIFYAEPVNEKQYPKSIPDYESAGATYISYENLKQIRLRGSEPEKWFKYVVDGKQIFPKSIFSSEND